MDHLEALKREADWMGYSEQEKKSKHKSEWDYIVEQLQTQNARNQMSYRRKGTGIIGNKHDLDEKMEYLIGWLAEFEGRE